MRNSGFIFTARALPAWAILFAACSSTQKASWEPEPAEPTAITEPATGLDPLTAQDGGLAGEREQLTLREQRRQFLLEEHIVKAKEFRSRLRPEDARQELLAARQIDGDNVEVKTLLAEINALLGVAGAEVSTVTETMSREYEIRTQQLRADASENLRTGKLMLARGDYDGAIAEFTICLNRVRWAPYAIDWQGVDEEADTLLTRAQSDREAAAEADRLAEQRRAYNELQDQRAAEDLRSTIIVTNILDQAIDAFAVAKYDDAMDFADQVLHQDPHNQQAADLRDNAFKAGREKVSNDYVKRKAEQYAKWQEQLRELRIPWNDVVTMPDQDRWREITRLRGTRRGLNLAAMVPQSERALRTKLQEMTVRMQAVEDEESLRLVMDYIRVITGLPIVVDPAAENAVLDEGILFTFSFENPLSVEQILNLITERAGEEVTWTIRHDAVLITTKEKARGKPIVFHHDVQDLIFGLTDFMGPRIDRIRLLDDLEDDDGGGPFGGIGERPQLINPDDLATMIQENVAVGTWEDGPTIESYEGHIIIVHTPEVQMQVQAFLEDLRRFSSSLVTIESKFMSVGDNWLQAIGVDLRGLETNPLTDVTNGLEDQASQGLDNNGTGSSGSNAAGAPSSGAFFDDGADGDFRVRTENFFGAALGASLSNIGGMTTQLTYLDDLNLSVILRAVEKSQNFELINDQVLSVHNTQRAYVTVINQKAYIQDFDVEVAQFQAVADPQVNVLTEGVVLDVRPTIHHNRKYLTLEVQPTVANIVNIREYSSTLGGNTSPVTFELPEIEVQSVFTTAVIPDGGSILLGGLSNIRNIERRAEVPWLANIPVLGFFFKKEGYSDEKESLMILIRAKITDIREEVKRLEGTY